jgi:hypothetical protein
MGICDGSNLEAKHHNRIVLMGFMMGQREVEPIFGFNFNKLHQVTSIKWQPVGESNPSCLVENQMS